MNDRVVIPHPIRRVLVLGHRATLSFTRPDRKQSGGKFGVEPVV